MVSSTGRPSLANTLEKAFSTRILTLRPAREKDGYQSDEALVREWRLVEYFRIFRRAESPPVIARAKGPGTRTKRFFNGL